MKRAPNLPKLADAAWHGPIGEAVGRIAPMSEADPVGVLVQTLALFGAMVGNGPYVQIGPDRHPAQIWPLIIGRTSSGRKGSSLGEARWLAREWGGYPAEYIRHRLKRGLASGEGLLENLGAQTKTDPDAEAPAPDGRLTVTETEFVNVLAMFRRDGNILGGVLRQLWDEGRGSTMTRSAPLTVEDSHLIVVGHCTPKEFRAKLADSDVAGGTANRFLFCAVQRPHLLPYDEGDRADVSDLARQIGDQIERARGWSRRIHRDRAANELWADVYYALNADEPDGSLGAVLARGPAYTMRLALVYALADGAGAVGVEHLLAGLAVWQYAAESARLVFGSGRRDDMTRLAEYIASASGGRSRTDVYNFFRRNKTSGEIDAMVRTFADRGDVTEETVHTGGRPLTLIHWTGAPLDAVGELLDRAAYTPVPASTP